MRLVIVESPTKAQTIQKYLGAGFRVVATAGHFRDLPEDALGVDVATFDPHYELISSKARYVAAIRKELAGAGEVYLATDADREGEAISWHLAQTFHLRGAKRMRFTEITPKALAEALAKAGPLDQHLVDAQQARRVLDRLVGYQVSPLLRPYGPNHSAGRVQTATLHLVVQREQERESFTAVPYWTVSVVYEEGFTARSVTRTEKGAWVDAQLPSETEATAIAAIARMNPHRITELETKPVERRPKAPFTTSTLQQAASVQLGLRPERTMASAQALFERGFISYHRTDSVALSPESIALARDFIAQDCPQVLPAEPVTYRQKASAQGAHEAIHPTAVVPALPEGLEGDELRLYDLIRRRFLASQCRPAVLAETTVLTQAGSATFRAKGSVVTFSGFLHYLDGDEDQGDREEQTLLPALRVGGTPELEEVLVERKQTAPRPRFTRATLIREMERLGIGRPSTFVTAVGALFDRDYLAEAKKQVLPTTRGRIIDHALGRAFPELGAATNTAQMEAQLDLVGEGRVAWKTALGSWYRPFAAKLAPAGDLFAADAARPEVRTALPEAPQATDKPCPRCRKALMLRQGRKGPFLACSGYPACNYVGDLSATSCSLLCPSCRGSMEQVAGKFGPYARCLNRDCSGRVDLAPPCTENCPTCHGAMRDRGSFLSCARYPECKGTRPKVVAAAAGERACPKCGSRLQKRKGPKGPFWGCSAYPTCKQTVMVTAERRRAPRTKAS